MVGTLITILMEQEKMKIEDKAPLEVHINLPNEEESLTASTNTSLGKFCQQKDGLLLQAGQIHEKHCFSMSQEMKEKLVCIKISFRYYFKHEIN